MAVYTTTTEFIRDSDNIKTTILSLPGNDTVLIPDGSEYERWVMTLQWRFCHIAYIWKDVPECGLECAVVNH